MEMESQLKRAVKEVIADYPGVEEALEEFGIGCGPCSVGTCLLGDVVEIHGLSPEEEAGLMGRIAGVVDSDNGGPPPELPRRAAVASRRRELSPPVRALVEEHRLIKRWLARIPELVEDIRAGALDADLLRAGVDFIRQYADRFHHAKEEDLLFGYVEGSPEILEVMHRDHTQARAHVAAILEALDRGDGEEIAEHLLAYRELLSQHIDKEDDILYPWIDRGLTTRQVGELHAAFAAVDREVGPGFVAHYEDFVHQVEARFSEKEER